MIEGDLFRSHGRILREDTELFPVQSWLFVMIGQNIVPRGYDPMADSLDPQKIKANLDDIRVVVKNCADAMPTHQDFIDRNCPAEALRGPRAAGPAPAAQKIPTYSTAKEPRS